MKVTEFDADLRFAVYDDFIPCPTPIRDSALRAGFGAWRPNKGEVGSSVYTGMSFWGDHAPLLRSLSAAFDGRPIFPNSMFFRVTNEDTEAAYVHSDREAGAYTAIVYLSEHAEDESGTGFYEHIETGLREMPTFAELARDPVLFSTLKTQMVEGSPEHWKQLRFVSGKFNRALIFHAPLFHSRVPKQGFGTTPEDGRMIWAAHFYI